MKDLLLEYVMKVSAITPTPAASTAYLRRVLCVVKPLENLEEGKKDVIATCTTTAEVAALTQSKCGTLLDAGMSSIYVLPATTLDLAELMNTTKAQFYTVLIDPAFNESEIGALELGSFAGVAGWANATQAEAAAWAKRNNNVAFCSPVEQGGKNMYFAFGKLLSSATWRNQQYIEMPESDGVINIGQADLFFDDALSFVLTSDEYGNRLGLFASNRRAIIAPYIFEEITIKLQSAALRYISLNQPAYTISEASLLEDTLQDVINAYIDAGTIESGTIRVEPSEQQFVMNGFIQVAEPKALWRIKAEMKQGV